MHLIVDSQSYRDPSPWGHGGGEGQLFVLTPETVAKVYHDGVNTSNERKQKVLALCNTFESSVAQSVAQLVAFPEFPAYEIVVSFDTIVGFSMRWFKDAPPIEEMGYDLTTNSFRESRGLRFNMNGALGFVYSIFEAVEKLHQSRIVLGDVNPGNILYNPATRKPVIIDLDSAQIGAFGCPVTHADYNDPNLSRRGQNLGGGMTFDAGTDLFALAVVTFEFLIGVRPFQVYTQPARPKGERENKLKGISNIRCFECGHEYLKQLNVSYLQCPENTAAERRLSQLRSEDRQLYDFFVRVFVSDERENLLFTLPITDPRHPGHIFLIESGFKRVIDDEAQRRRRHVAAQARQGIAPSTAALPSSGFRELIASMSSATPEKTSPHSSGQASAMALQPSAATGEDKSRADPQAFVAFIRHFDLEI